MNSLIIDKPTLRASMRILRRTPSPEEREDAARAVAEHLLPHIPADCLLGAYWPLGSELSSAPLLAGHLERGGRVALPRIEGENLTFHPWRIGDTLEAGPMGIRQPSGTLPAVMPEVIVTALLAFDARGYRLGYGGGFYDRLLARLAVPSFGLAYGFQEVATLPTEPHDQRLTGVATPDGVRWSS